MTSTNTFETRQFSWEWEIKNHSSAVPGVENLDCAQEAFPGHNLLSGEHSGWVIGKRISNTTEDALCIPGASLYEAYRLEEDSKILEAGLVECFPPGWTEDVVSLNAMLRTLENRESRGLREREVGYGQLPNGEMFLYGLNRVGYDKTRAVQEPTQRILELVVDNTRESYSAAAA